MYNLLLENVLCIKTKTGVQHVSLPKLMEALGQDTVLDFPGIQRHQEDAFHVFLSYLAGIILSRQAKANPVQPEAYWLNGLRSLAGSAGDDAWTLLVSDYLRPAFLQPPLPKADHDRIAGGEPSFSTPDDMDLLVTAKNHDVKQAKMLWSNVCDWVYALISLQTMGGFLGRGNQGVSRMNGGYGSRLIVELVGRESLGGRWQDAVLRLLEYRREMLADTYGYNDSGLALLWIEPWDGNTRLSLSQLDPFYLEICRRIRLCIRAGNIAAYNLPSSNPRIAAKELKGMVGDPWLPIDAKKEASLDVPPRGLAPDVLRRVVFMDNIRLTALQRSLPVQQDSAWLKLSVLVRGEGSTNGFHEKSILLPLEIRRKLFGSPEQREPLAELSKTALDYAGKMHNNVLKTAIFTYLQGSPEKLQFDRKAAKEWWGLFARRYDAFWSDEYFPWLWSASEKIDKEKGLEKSVLKDWVIRLRTHALQILDEAEAALPVRAGRAYRSRVKARTAFWGTLYKNFPSLKDLDCTNGEGGNRSEHIAETRS